MVPPVLRLRDILGRLRRGIAPPSLRVIESAEGLIEGKALYAAVMLRVPEALAAGPLSTADLARDVGADVDALGRLMRLLAGRGYFARYRRAMAEQPDLGSSPCGPPRDAAVVDPVHRIALAR
ncbi:MAG: hypothetical protein M5T61_01570 [Acidimicrobiia bacterium]|nr:hypothetical protein [Acidimicrobiia bacterium]